MSKVDYNSLLQGKSYDEQVKFYKDLYDSVIQFDDYYRKMFPSETLERNTPCKLHDEAIDGKSFAYTKDQNLWTCFGSCHTSGRVTHFHYLFRRKINPNISMLKCIEELYNLFCFDINQLYRELPKPIISKGVSNYKSPDEFVISIPTDLGKSRLDFDNIDINLGQSDSNRVLGLFMTKSRDNNQHIK